MRRDYRNKAQIRSKEIKKIEGIHTCETVTTLKDLDRIKRKFKLDSFHWIQEAVILREFTRRVHHYIADESIPKSTLEWFALMRHYGAPSRLLDCTYSFYVAEFFALRNLNQMDCTAAIWAINRDWLRDCRKAIFGDDVSFKSPKEFYDYFLNHNNDEQKVFVSEVNPFRINQRLTAQQGVFLCPANTGKSFMKNLLSMAAHVDPLTQKYYQGIIRIPIASDIKPTLIQELHPMNISSATLFPDLIGFAESLTQWFYLPNTIMPPNDELDDALRNVFPDEQKAKKSEC